jgi:hypothetical protein
MNPSLILDKPVHNLYYFPSVGVVGLVEYLCTHPIYIYLRFSSEEDPNFVVEDVE